MNTEYKWIVQLDDRSGEKRILTGGKASGVWSLHKMGLPVPKGFALSTAAYFSARDASGSWTETCRQAATAIRDGDTDRAAGILQHWSASLELTDGIRDEIMSMVRVLPSKMVVRSSATIEDRMYMTGAGLWLTELEVSVGTVCEKILNCWRSLWCDGGVSLINNEDIEQSLNNIAMAVLIQEQIEARASGILFTRNPMNGNQDSMVINTVPGLGDDLAQGRQIGYTLFVNRRNFSEVNAAVNDSENPLNAGDITILCSYAAKAEAILGYPLDIEFAFSDTELFLLQVRAASCQNREEKIMDGIDNSNVSSIPLFWQKMDDCTKAWSMEHVHKLPVTRPPLRQSKIDRNMTLIQASLARDGFDMPPYLIYLGGYCYRGLDEPSDEGNTKGFNCILKCLARTSVFLGSYGKWIVWNIYKPFLIQRYRVYLPDRLKKKNMQQLNNTLNKFMKNFVNDWYLHCILENSAPRALREFCLKLELCSENDIANLLIGTARDSFGRYGRQLQKYGLHSLDNSEESIREILSNPGFGNWLEKYGLRLVSGEDILSPTWIENPVPILKLLLSSGQGADNYDAYHKTLRNIRQSLKKYTWKEKLKFRLKLYAARIGGRFLDDHNCWLDQPTLAAFRIIHLEIGQRLVDKGFIEKPDDVFYLYDDELDRLIHIYIDNDAFAQDYITSLRKVSTARRKWDNSWRSQIVARKLNTSGNTNIIKVRDGILKGVPASPGTATGRAIVITGREEKPIDIEPGDILVCPVLLPAWLPYLKIAGGVVADGGNMLCHGAILVRESGVPAVFGTGIATRLICNGDFIIIDGSNGLIYLEQGEKDISGEGLPPMPKIFPEEWQHCEDRFRSWHLLPGQDSITYPFEASLMNLALSAEWREKIRLFWGRWYTTDDNPDIFISDYWMDTDLIHLELSDLLDIWDKILKDGYTKKQEINGFAIQNTRLWELAQLTMQHMAKTSDFNEVDFRLLYLPEILAYLRDASEFSIRHLIENRRRLYDWYSERHVPEKIDHDRGQLTL